MRKSLAGASVDSKDANIKGNNAKNNMSVNEFCEIHGIPHSTLSSIIKRLDVKPVCIAIKQVKNRYGEVRNRETKMYNYDELCAITPKALRNLDYFRLVNDGIGFNPGLKHNIKQRQILKMAGEIKRIL